MKSRILYWFKYISYFFYLGINWNFPLAWFIVSREIKGEKKYGIRCTGVDDLANSVSKSQREHASIYQPLNFFTAEKLFDQLTATDLNGTFLDVGCGKGRILSIAAHYGFKEIIGIDFSAKLCHEAVLNADIIEAHHPGCSIVISCEDAREYIIPPEVTVVFLFNPFDDLVMIDFINQLKESLRKKSRPIKILYANPQCRKQFLDNGFSEIFHFKKMHYLQGSLLINNDV